MTAMAQLLPLLSTTIQADAPFWNGANLPWYSFGRDIGGGAWNSTWFNSTFDSLNANGANSVRFWLHADGRATPTFASDGTVIGLGSSTFSSDLESLVALAASHSLILQLCLWSFDMCKQDIAGEKMHDDLISDQAKTSSYITNALLPILAAIGEATNVVIEVINEPEWCMEGPCNTENCVAVAEMQRFVSMVAEAVHAHSSLAVTVGSASLKWSTARPGGGQANFWSDTALAAAYSSPIGKLDFYNVHYYDWMYSPDWGYDPCRSGATPAYWGIDDKAVVIGELPSTSAHYSATGMLQCAIKNGFAGDLFWAINDPSFDFAPALAALARFSAAHPSQTSYPVLLSWLRSLRSTAPALPEPMRSRRPTRPRPTEVSEAVEAATQG